MRPPERDDRGTEGSRPAGSEGPGSRPAGPVAGNAFSPSQATGEGPNPTPPAGGASEQDSPDLDRVEHDLDELLSQRDEYLDLAKRTKADFENYRKRMSAEVQASVTRGKAEVVGGLIGVIDNLERALEAAGIDANAETAPDNEPLAQGVLLTYRDLRNALERAGVETYDPRGEKFDPAWHEAIQKVQIGGAEASAVVEVLQKGYRLDGQVLRAAKVVVSE